MLKRRSVLVALCLIALSVPFAAGCGPKAAVKDLKSIAPNSQFHVSGGGALPGTGMIDMAGYYLGLDGLYHFEWIAGAQDKSDYKIFECDPNTFACAELITVSCGLNLNCSARYTSDQFIITAPVVSQFDSNNKAVGPGLVNFDIPDVQNRAKIDSSSYQIQAVPAVAQ